MSPAVVSGIVFACVFGGALLGMSLRPLLPERHATADSKDVVKLGMGLIATMAALVLGLLIASAKGSYDTQRAELTQMSTDIVLLDSVLARYGPEAHQARALIRRGVVSALDRIWPADSSRPLDPIAARGEVVFEAIQTLAPQSEAQRTLQTQALNIALGIARTRWLLFEQSGSSIPLPFLVVLVFWLTILFASFNLFAPRNATIIATMVVCSLSVAGALFLILELDRPFQGLIRIPSAPLRNALAHLDQ